MWQVYLAFVKSVHNQVCTLQARVLQDVCKDLGQGNPRIYILEERFTCMIVLLPYVRDKRWLSIGEQVDEAAEDGRGVVDARIGALAEEEG